MDKKQKQPTKTCGECIHEYACSMWNVGTMHNTCATNCVNHETVKDSAAYLIGKMDAVEVGSDPTAAGGGNREGSEWQRSAGGEPALSGEGSAGYRNRTHGRWEQVQRWATKAKYRCSVCGREVMSAIKVNIEKYPYCHCGAKMDLKGE